MKEFLNQQVFGPEHPGWREFRRRLDHRLETEICDHSYEAANVFPIASSVLENMGVNVAAMRREFVEHGLGCDCDVLLNVQSEWPDWENIYGCSMEPRCCDDCAGPRAGNEPIVHDHLWLGPIGAGPFEVLCGACMVRRLGRKFTLDDLERVPFNKLLIEMLESQQQEMTT